MENQPPLTEWDTSTLEKDFAKIAKIAGEEFVVLQATAQQAENGKFPLWGSVKSWHAASGEMEFFRVQFMALGKLPEGARSGAKSSAGRNDNRLNIVQVLIDHRERRASFGPASGIIASPAGHGVGSLLMARVVEWASQRYADYSVSPGKISPLGPVSTDEEVVLTHFFGNFRFDLIWKNERHESGHITKNKVGNLVARYPSERIRVVAAEEAFDRMLAISAEAFETRKALLEAQRSVEKFKLLYESERSKHFIHVTAIVLLGLMMAVETWFLFVRSHG